MPKIANYNNLVRTEWRTEFMANKSEATNLPVYASKFCLLGSGYEVSCVVSEMK